MKAFFLQTVSFFSARPFESFFLLPLILFFGWYLLALFDIFIPSLVATLFFIVGLLFVYFVSRRPAFLALHTLVLGILLTVFATFALLSHPIELVAEGRDQGTFIHAALLLNEHSSFTFLKQETQVFFSLFGPGKALNFPGFAYTELGALIPEFPLGYIVWLSGFYTLFGISGFAFANALLYILSGFLLYRLLQRATSPFYSFLLTLLFMGSFLPLWFVSFPLTENLALFFFLLSVEVTNRFFIQKDPLSLWLLILTTFAFALTRIEGWVVFICALLFVFLTPSLRASTHRIFISYPKQYLFTFFILSGISLLTFTLNFPYYKAITKALLKSGSQSLASSILIQDSFPLYSVLGQYGLSVPFLLGIGGILFLITKKRTLALIPAILGVITFVYLLFPHITLDAPWMLRRFHFILYPTLFLAFISAFSLFIASLSPRRKMYAWWIVLVGFAVIQIPVTQKYIETSYTETLFKQAENLSKQFTEKDLLLIDKGVTGDNFMIPAYTLSHFFQRPAVYFYNPSDFEKMNTSSYERVFLLTPESKKSFYEQGFGKSLETTEIFMFINDHSFLQKNNQNSILPEKNTLVTNNLLIQLQ